MELWVFSSKTWENVNIGYEHRLWAVAESLIQRRTTRSALMEVHSRGILWDVERQGFTMPFRTLSPADQKRKVHNVWPDKEPWVLPFEIQPLASPTTRAGKQHVKQNWLLITRLLDGGRQFPNPVYGIGGLTVFHPITLFESEWRQILTDCGGDEAVAEDRKFSEPLGSSEVLRLSYNAKLTAKGKT